MQKNNVSANDINNIAERVSSDAKLKSTIMANPKQALADAGINLPNGIEVAVHENTDKLFHFVIPGNPNQELNDESLSSMNAAKGSASTAGSMSSAGTLSTIVSTWSSASTAATAASAGSK